MAGRSLDDLLEAAFAAGASARAEIRSRGVSPTPGRIRERYEEWRREFLPEPQHDDEHDYDEMPEPCLFERAWRGACTKPKPCPDHPPVTCANIACPNMATRECPTDLELSICGVRICGECEHLGFGHYRIVQDRPPVAPDYYWDDQNKQHQRMDG